MGGHSPKFVLASIVSWNHPLDPCPVQWSWPADTAHQAFLWCTAAVPLVRHKACSAFATVSSYTCCHSSGSHLGTWILCIPNTSTAITIGPLPPHTPALSEPPGSPPAAMHNTIPLLAGHSLPHTCNSHILTSATHTGTKRNSKTLACTHTTMHSTTHPVTLTFTVPHSPHTHSH